MISSLIKYTGKLSLVAIDGGKIVNLNNEEYLPYAFVDKVGKDKVEKMCSNLRETDLRAPDGREVLKYECSDPKDVARIRDALGSEGIKTYEADIPYIRRLLIDRIYEVDYSGSQIYVDIEVDDSKGFPTQYGEFKIISIATDSNWFYVGDYNSEWHMLDDFVKTIEADGKTVFVGWNVEFDYNHILGRAKKLGVKCRWLEFVHTLDLMDMYKGVVKGLESYSLDEVSVHEGFGHKRRSKLVSEMTRSELEEYNKRDVELCVEIDKKYGFTEIQFELAKMTNLTLDMLTPITIADTLILRRAREIGYVLDNGKFGNKQGYVGAYVKEPKPGIHRWVAYFDVASMYPSIIVNNKIDIDGFNGEIVPHIVVELLSERARCKKMYSDTGEKRYDIKQQVLKILVNMMYGCFGNKYFRYFDEKKAEQIVEEGRKIIRRIEEFVNNTFGEVLYADTDSIFVDLSKSIRDYNKIEAFTKLVNKEINEFIKPYEVKLETIFESIIFFRTGEQGAKKRYWGWTIDGEEVIRGVEIRRSDWCKLVKMVQKDVMQMIKDGKAREEILKYLVDVKKKLFAGEYDEYLVIVKGFRDISEYKVKQPHVRALEKAIAKGYRYVDGKVRYVFVGDDVEPVINGLDEFKGKLNYTLYWNNQIYSTVKRILDSVYGSKQMRLEVGGEKR